MVHWSPDVYGLRELQSGKLGVPVVAGATPSPGRLTL